MSTEFTVETEGPDYNIKASVRLIGDDLLVAVWGGEKPHIGAVSIAQHRQSLADSSKSSASASVFCVVGHKEDELARKISLELSTALEKNVVVTAGIHWDDLKQDAISQILKNCNTISVLIEAQLS